MQDAMKFHFAEMPLQAYFSNVRPAQSAQRWIPIDGEGFLHVWSFQCGKVVKFQLNFYLTPFYHDLEFRLECQLIIDHLYDNLSRHLIILFNSLLLLLSSIQFSESHSVLAPAVHLLCGPTITNLSVLVTRQT